MVGNQPDGSVMGASADPEVRDPAAPEPEPVPAAGEPIGAGVDRGSLRRSQWSAPATGARAPGDEGDGGASAGEPDGRPAGSGGRGSRHSTAVLAAVLVLLVGLAVVVVSVISGRVRKPAESVDTPASVSSRAAQGRVKAGMDVATPTPSSRPSAKKTAAGTNKNPAGPAGKPPGHAKAPAVRGPAPIARWKLGSGAGPLGRDATSAYPLALSDVTRGAGHGGSAVFNGVDSQATASGPVLYTAGSRSFTVSAWVYLTENDRFATAVSQDGEDNSGFYLQYSHDENRWAFARPGAGARALSSAVPKLKTWTHLVGVFDAATEQTVLYVDGARQATVAGTFGKAADGPLAIGRGQFLGRSADWFPGRINDVEIFNMALTTAQVKAV